MNSGTPLYTSILKNWYGAIPNFINNPAVIDVNINVLKDFGVYQFKDTAEK
jgi:hypothetical protein